MEFFGSIFRIFRFLRNLFSLCSDDDPDENTTQSVVNNSQVQNNYNTITFTPPVFKEPPIETTITIRRRFNSISASSSPYIEKDNQITEK